MYVCTILISHITTNRNITQMITTNMTMIIVAAALTPAAMTTVRSRPLSDLPLDVGCTGDVVVCIGVIVHDMIFVDVSEAVRVDVSEAVCVDVSEAVCVDVSEAVCVDVTNIFVNVGTSVQEVADGLYAGMLSNDPT